MPNVCPDCEYLFQERAAIHEFDGRAYRVEAERMASGERCAAHRLKITVHNLDRGKPGGDCEYIGRPRTLGNPFVIGPDGSRAEVIAMYRVWLWKQVKAKTKVFAKLCELAPRARAAGGLTLLCHCKPMACHGDVIAECLGWMEREGLI